jgi:hypothetical protein
MRTAPEPIAKPEWLYPESKPSTWLFPQEKAALKTFNKRTLTLVSLEWRDLARRPSLAGFYRATQAEA